MRKSLLKALLPVVCLLLVSGCGLKFTIKDTPASGFTYSKTDTAPATLTIVDQRKGDDAQFIGGRIGVGGMTAVSSLVSLENMEDPIRYLSANLGKELVRRGVPIKCSVGTTEGPGLTLYVDQYQIVSFRLTGFSPWECSHVFSGRLVANGKSSTIKAYFYNGRMPVWSMNEIAEPCFNIPVSIMVKDIASKINKVAFALSVSDSRVQELKAGIDEQIAKKDIGETFWRVIDLGSSNNPSAMEPLKKYAQEKDDFLKSCALDSIGILGPGPEMDFLRRNVFNGSYNDRYMAIKAIGDIGTPEAVQFIRELKQNSSYQGEGGFRTVVDLYSR